MTSTIRKKFWNDTVKNSMDKRKDDMHEPRNVVKFFFFGPSQWSRQVLSGPRPIRLCEAAAGLNLFSQRVRTEALYKHSGVHAASIRQFIIFSVLSLSHHDL